MFTHWTKKRSKCSIDSFISTHFNLDFLTIVLFFSLAFLAIYRAHVSVLMKYNSCHFIIILYIVELSYMGYTLIFLCNFCLFVVASCSWTSKMRLIHESTFSLALAFVGEMEFSFWNRDPRHIKITSPKNFINLEKFRL